MKFQHKKRNAGLLFLLAFSLATISAVSAGEKDYKLSPGDVVEVKVFREEALSLKSRVTETGQIAMPLIGKVRLAGLSTSQAADSIRRKLADGYLVKPQVTLSVAAPAKRHFTVLGQVSEPGRYALPDYQAITLVQAIGMAGGFSELANRRKVTIKRSTKAGETARSFNVLKMAKMSREKQVAVLPGDIIVVAESIF